ncbi:MAG: DUF192 domain-containing protein [Jiangellales bacterium]
MRPAAALAAPAAATLLLVGCTTETAQAAPTVVVGEAEPIVVEVADNDAERAAGLMGRDEVPSGTGMVFIYPEPVSNAFWMGNVEVPLSIVWVRDDTVVGLAEMQPCPAADDSCPRYSPGADYTHAVETTGGTFTKAGVQVGDPVTMTGLDAQVTP